MDKKDYIVTEKAGPRVAGRAVTVGQKLQLTEAEALYERQTGSIRLDVPPVAAAPAEAVSPTPPAPAPTPKKK